MWTDPENLEIGTVAAQFPEKEEMNVIFVAVCVCSHAHCACLPDQRTSLLAIAQVLLVFVDKPADKR
jgi:hypothetical protein